LSRLKMPSGAILGVLVLFRFFPTMRTELREVRESLHNRGLTTVERLLLHPALSVEYLLVPMLMRCLQSADQLSVSAVARGVETPGTRSSYYVDDMRPYDIACAVIITVATAGFLIIGGIG
jgi:energy-coupling factor transport system permease protein